VVGAGATFLTGRVQAKQVAFGFSATASEDAEGKAGIFRLRMRGERVSATDLARALAAVSSPRSPVRSVSKLVKAGWTPRFELRGRLNPGWYVYAIRLRRR